MKFLLFCFLLVVLGCKTNQKDELHTEVEPDESPANVEELAEERTWDYSELYGQYLHESNGKGFMATLELTPLGDDLSFTLNLLQGKCEVNLNGIIGMIYHGETEYAGFYDDESCRLSFNFFRIENTIRVDEVGICREHAIGCSFDGAYIKKKE